MIRRKNIPAFIACAVGLAALGTGLAVHRDYRALRAQESATLRENFLQVTGQDRLFPWQECYVDTVAADAAGFALRKKWLSWAGGFSAGARSLESALIGFNAHDACQAKFPPKPEEMPRSDPMQGMG